MSRTIDKIANCIRPKIEGLENLWLQIGYRNEVVEGRVAEVLHFFGKLADDMLKEENECKEEILEDIAESKAEVERLCRDLGLPLEKPDTTDKPLMAVWDAYQSVNAKLKVLRQERVEKLKVLNDMEHPLCSRLGETPLSLIKENETPTDKQFLEVEKNISRLKKLQEERLLEFNRLRNSLMQLIADLDLKISVTSESDFHTSVVANDAPNVFVLSSDNMKRVSSWHADLTKTHSTYKSEAQRLRDQIISVGRRLRLSDNELAKQSLTTNKTPQSKCSSQIIEELSRNLAMLNAEKLRQLPLVIEQTRKELRDAFDKCWFGEDERRKYHTLLTSTEHTDELLAQLDTAVVEMRKFRNDNDSLLALVDKWNELWVKQQALDERAADSNRYKNRGGALLQEEKERKEVASALPKKEQELYTAATEYMNLVGAPFLILGMTAEQFIESKRVDYEYEKQRKREIHKATGTSVLSTAKKQCRPTGAPPSASRIVTPLTNSTRSNLRQGAKIGASTPNLATSALRQNTPLTASTRHLNIHDDQEQTLSSMSKTNRKRTSGHTIVTASSQSPAKKRCIESHVTSELAASSKKKTTSSKNIRHDLVSPAPRMFASPLGASSPSLTNLRQPIRNGKVAPVATKSTTRIDPKAALKNSRNTSVRQKQPQPQQPAEGYPFSKHIPVSELENGGSVIDFKNLPDSFLGNNNDSLIFHNGTALDPDSGVLAGHSDTADLAVDSIMIPTSHVVRPQPVVPSTTSHRFAMPPPQLSSTMIGSHSLRSGIRR